MRDFERGVASPLSRIMYRMAVVLAFVGMPGIATAADADQTKTAAGLTAYVGLMPAAIVWGHPKTHAETRMHGGPPTGAHAYHLTVAIFDATTGARIEDAKVAARVSSLGLLGPRKALEPMKIADTITYGNYFDLPGKGAYRINVQVERPQGTVVFEFNYEH